MDREPHVDNLLKQLELLKANANEKVKGLKQVELYVNSELSKLCMLVDSLPKNNSWEALSKAVNLFVDIMALLERIEDLEKNISEETNSGDTMGKDME